MKKAARKPNLQQFMAAKVAGIRKAFTVPMRVTIVVRNPASTELEAVFSDDDIDGLITCLQRRRDQVMAGQGRPPGAAEIQPALDGVALIAAERQRQQRHPSEGGEGWTRQHDEQEHDGGHLSMAASCYALYAAKSDASRDNLRLNVAGGSGPHWWPWALQWWKPGADNSCASRVRELVKAGALIAAEIERLQRSGATR